MGRSMGPRESVRADLSGELVQQDDAAELVLHRDCARVLVRAAHHHLPQLLHSHGRHSLE